MKELVLFITEELEFIRKEASIHKFRLIFHLLRMNALLHLLNAIDQIILFLFAIKKVGLDQVNIYMNRMFADPRMMEIYNSFDTPAAKKPESDTELSSPAGCSLISKLSERIEASELYKNPDLNVETLCREMATNRTYLLNEIKREKFVTVPNYINSFRLRKATELLSDAKHNHLSLITVAELTGFHNYGTFNVAFKKQYGITPGEWRRRTQ